MFQQMNGFGAYYAPKYEQAIHGLGQSGCGCSGAAGLGDTFSYPSLPKIALACGAAALVVYLAMKIEL